MTEQERSLGYLAVSESPNGYLRVIGKYGTEDEAADAITDETAPHIGYVAEIIEKRG